MHIELSVVKLERGVFVIDASYHTVTFPASSLTAIYDASGSGALCRFESLRLFQANQSRDALVQALEAFGIRLVPTTTHIGSRECSVLINANKIRDIRPHWTSFFPGAIQTTTVVFKNGSYMHINGEAHDFSMQIPADFRPARTSPLRSLIKLLSLE
jgi:hypothetical protein